MDIVCTAGARVAQTVSSSMGEFFFGGAGAKEVVGVRREVRMYSVRHGWSCPVGHKDGMALNDLAAERAVDGDVLVVDRVLGFSKEEGGAREGAVKVVHRHIPSVRGNVSCNQVNVVDPEHGASLRDRRQHGPIFQRRQECLSSCQLWHVAKGGEQKEERKSSSTIRRHAAAAVIHGRGK